VHLHGKLLGYECDKRNISAAMREYGLVTISG